VLKKDITYQPWWSYWWWALPWRLGYGYERILTVNPDTNIDCRGLLYDQLHLDVDASVLGVELQDLTHLALQEGRGYDPTAVDLVAPENPPALVAIVGRCDKINSTTASADYVLVSNKGPTDASPHSGEPDYDTLVVYPWLPGRWHDLTVVMPQNIEVDLDAYIRKWPTARWTEAGADISTVQSAMAYYFPYWCGWGHWWGWQANDCIDIGVGEGKSIDVEQITPVRVFMSQWPPVP
jgi:hypothetical protein